MLTIKYRNRSELFSKERLFFHTDDDLSVMKRAWPDKEGEDSGADWPRTCQLSPGPNSSHPPQPDLSWPSVSSLLSHQSSVSTPRIMPSCLADQPWPDTPSSPLSHYSTTPRLLCCHCHHVRRWLHPPALHFLYQYQPQTCHHVTCYNPVTMLSYNPVTMSAYSHVTILPSLKAFCHLSVVSHS